MKVNKRSSKPDVHYVKKTQRTMFRMVLTFTFSCMWKQGQRARGMVKGKRSVGLRIKAVSFESRPGYI